MPRLPALGWRLDTVWNRMRDEAPHVRRPPSESFAGEHFWVTTQPMEEPEKPGHLMDVLNWIGSTGAVCERLSALGFRRSVLWRSRRASTRPHARAFLPLGKCAGAVLGLRDCELGVAAIPGGWPYPLSVVCSPRGGQPSRRAEMGDRQCHPFRSSVAAECRLSSGRPRAANPLANS